MVLCTDSIGVSGIEAKAGVAGESHKTMVAMLLQLNS
jgi:hypothetical protein